MTENTILNARQYSDDQRSTFRGDLEGLSTNELDRRVFPETMSIGTSILHTIGFEYLLTTGIRQNRGEPYNADLWEQLRYGFARDLGLDQTTGQPLEYYLELLQEVREGTNQLLESGNSETFERVDLEAIIRELGEEDDDAESLGYSTDAKLTPHSTGQINLPIEIAQHESYHRGQITFMKYLFRQDITRKLQR